MTVEDKPIQVRSEEALDPVAVETYLKENIPDLEGDIQIFQYPGGYSNLTYEIHMGQRKMVLRRPPIGAKVDKGHDMAREFQVLSLVHPLFDRCPKPLCLCTDTDVIGAPFFVMEKKSGIILRKDLPSDLGLSPDQARNLCKNMVDLLADIHAMDGGAGDLAALGRPKGYVQRQVAGWIKRYQAAKTPDAPGFDRVTAWLEDKQPEGCPTPSLIHNDYKLDNLVLDSAAPEKIIGVLDWEMATCGDPLMDLGSSLAYWVQADDPENLQMIRTMPTHLPGCLTREEIVRHYARKRGLEIRNFDFYYGFGLFRLAVIAQQIYHRYYHGKTRNKRFAMLIFAVQILEQTALNLLEKSKI